MKNPDQKNVMPKEPYIVKLMAYDVNHLYLRFREFQENEILIKKDYPWTSRFVCGYPVPEFQRPLVWSRAQNRKFILSVWTRTPIGSYMLNNNIDNGKFGAHGELPLYCDAVLDGQQRLNALEQYWLNKFSLKGLDGKPYFWKDLSDTEQRRFRNTIFPQEKVALLDLEALKELYNLRNFSGITHKKSERAI